MKIKTNELKDAALDWAVAKCEAYPMGIWYDEKELPIIRDDEVPEWNPSTNWSQGGSLIERVGIALLPPELAEMPGYEGRGETLLIAAMRCYVSSKLGDEIEIPEELAA